MSNNKVTMYGLTQGCDYCTRAKNILKQNGVKFDFVDVAENLDTLKFFKRVHRTVPQLYCGDVHLGDSQIASKVQPDGTIAEEDDLTLD